MLPKIRSISCMLNITSAGKFDSSLVSLLPMIRETRHVPGLLEEKPFLSIDQQTEHKSGRASAFLLCLMTFLQVFLVCSWKHRDLLLGGGGAERGPEDASFTRLPEPGRAGAVCRGAVSGAGVHETDPELRTQSWFSCFGAHLQCFVNADT